MNGTFKIPSTHQRYTSININNVVYILNICYVNMCNQLKIKSLQNEDKFPRGVCVCVCMCVLEVEVRVTETLAV